MKVELEYLTSKWWFFVVLFFVSFFLPHLTTVPYEWSQSQVIIIEVMRYGLPPYQLLAVVYHLSTLGLIIALWKYGSRITRFVYGYVGLHYLIIAVTNNLAVTPSYGFVIILSNMSLFLIIAATSFYAIKQKNPVMTKSPTPWWVYILIPLVILAFWSPMNPDGVPDFNLMLFLTSEFGIAFCFTTPVYIFILSLYYPSVNRPLFRSLSAIGLLYGIINILGPLTTPGYPIWVVVLHLPLLIISLYGVILPRLTKA